MDNTILGIDIGSVSIALVEITSTGDILGTSYRMHGGKIAEGLIEMLGEFDLSRVESIAATTSTPAYVKVATRYDNQTAHMEAVHHLHPQVGAILNVGGERFSLVFYDEQGRYRRCRTNTSCAAGTGSFLDQQASRLSLRDITELSELAHGNTGAVPKIASRCAVFAKTDLIHAQQEGYSLEEICDGLCHGLAKNIVDTVCSLETPRDPVIFCGGVSKNPAVRRHLCDLMGTELIVDEYSHVYGALGAALHHSRERSGLRRLFIIDPSQIIMAVEEEKHYAYEGLDLNLSDYPDFSAHDQYIYHVTSRTAPSVVEVDVYEAPVAGQEKNVYLGIDVGSTSTKAVLLDEDKNVLAGFYTRTVGRPVDAVCALFEAICTFMEHNEIRLTVIGAGTTGSGRKLTGRVIGADLILDEITAHARAACELNPKVDTIIEIGGQDSKFTTLKDSRVTFSIMNTVCAAGTGSFIEEQAKRMGVPIDEYADRTRGACSPISSDRCTVFMERDMNHYLTVGYSADEVLASALHSVRENYLTKVAIEASIGDVIFFQGATAKNRALIAAFEQRLGKPILVSRYCHLTGALGTALSLADEGVSRSTFRGLSLYTRKIPVRSEICTFCTNSCKITIADIDGSPVAYGFLCGRDYETRRFVDNNSSGFDLIKQRSDAFSFRRKCRNPTGPTVGIPAALHIFEDVEFWEYFFDQLSIRTITSRAFRDGIKEGRHISGAEFCAPLVEFHGHVKHLLDRSDFVFVPFYLEEKTQQKGVRRQYCYYTQFAPSLVSGANPGRQDRILTPLVNYLYSRTHTKRQLWQMVQGITDRKISLLEVSSALENALRFKRESLQRLQEIFRRERTGATTVSVALLGRPYTALSPSMNKGIVSLFASRGIRVFSQEMIPVEKEESPDVKELTDELHWRHASGIVSAAASVACMSGMYPVLLTSFRCAPDSFAVDYFKKVMDAYAKPYLVLQLDEHDSNVGYETRIEAAIRSFENHHHTAGVTSPRIIPSVAPTRSFSGKTVVFPNWDPLSCRLLVANLMREGIDARLIKETETSTLKSLKYNTGQCIPLSIIAQEYIDFMEQSDLDPARSVLWIGRGELACNVKLIPHHIKNVLNTYGKGMEKAGVYHGEISMKDVSLRATVGGYFAFMFGGLLRRLSCSIRPYERVKGMTDRVLEESLEIIEESFLGIRSRDRALREVMQRFHDIPVRKEHRQKVAIFGDLYVRDNDFANQGLISFIEEHGGEVVTTPYSAYMKMIAQPYFRKWMGEGKYIFSLSSRAFLSTLKQFEKRYAVYFESLLGECGHDYGDDVSEILGNFAMIPEHSGESMDNILKTHYIRKYYPDVSLFIQTSPAFCCPALVTEAMARSIEEYTGVPVVSITYDGTCSNKNRVIIPYLYYPRAVADHPRNEEALETILKTLSGA
ncbi:MAG: acyl-CoA dehydratase activase [Desulfomonilia bacterium]